MPLPIMMAHKLVRRLSEARRQGVLDFLRPDGKSQVSVEYVGNKPKRIEAVVISTQHSPDVSTEDLRREVKKHIIDRSSPPNMVDSQTKYHINPTGRFVVGGPHGDTGLTGRKIIVDTYGGMGRHGGGAFSGKDPTKVDRSACYMARYIAKNIVASKLASRCEVQLAYAIGVAEPVSVHGEHVRHRRDPDDRFTELVRENFSLTPRGIIETPEAAPSDLSQDRGVRPLRPHRRYLSAGKPPTRPKPVGSVSIGRSKPARSKTQTDLLPRAAAKTSLPSAENTKPAGSAKPGAAINSLWANDTSGKTPSDGPAPSKAAAAWVPGANATKTERTRSISTLSDPDEPKRRTRPSLATSSQAPSSLTAMDSGAALAGLRPGSA
jgi:hypothetical protein